MLWTDHHLWPSVTRLVFNCYPHWSSLILRSGNDTDNFIHSREGVAQGDPLYMVTYCIRILTMIKNPKAEFTEITQTFYSDNAGALETF